ncbi:MAG TPA: hypothetical protein VM223_02875 [Planctomycetota bacterium]|nr:hypothetical protein [Planctomycetota bacterium]
MDCEKAIRFAQSLDRSAESVEKLYGMLLKEFSLPRPPETPRERKGKLITFDGHSGTGKDTQLALLRDYMCSDHRYAGMNVVPLVQKRSDPFRQVVKALWENRELLDDDCSFLLLTAGRRFFVYGTVLPRLEDARNVILQNRSYLSHVAYCARDTSEIPSLLAVCNFDPVADLPFVLGCDIDAAFGRVVKRSPEKGGVIYPNERPDYTARVKSNFNALAGLVDGLRQINTTGPAEGVAAMIRGCLDGLLFRGTR